jgi:hypothetical protein
MYCSILGILDRWRWNTLGSETSVQNYHHTLRNVRERRRSQPTDETETCGHRVLDSANPVGPDSIQVDSAGVETFPLTATSRNVSDASWIVWLDSTLTNTYMIPVHHCTLHIVVSLSCHNLQIYLQGISKSCPNRSPQDRRALSNNYTEHTDNHCCMVWWRRNLVSKEMRSLNTETAGTESMPKDNAFKNIRVP